MDRGQLVPGGPAKNTVEAMGPWTVYVQAIRQYLAGSSKGGPLFPEFYRQFVEDGLERVLRNLRLLMPCGVVAKNKASHRPSSDKLWEIFDRYVRRQIVGSKSEPGDYWKLTKAEFTRDVFDRYVRADAKYERVGVWEVHHMWPRAIWPDRNSTRLPADLREGPDVGWNMLPVHPLYHHRILHVHIFTIVHSSSVGQTFRLV